MASAFDHGRPSWSIGAAVRNLNVPPGDALGIDRRRRHHQQPWILGLQMPGRQPGHLAEQAFGTAEAAGGRCDRAAIQLIVRIRAQCEMNCKQWDPGLPAPCGLVGHRRGRLEHSA